MVLLMAAMVFMVASFMAFSIQTTFLFLLLKSKSQKIRDLTKHQIYQPSLFLGTDVASWRLGLLWASV